MVPNTHRARRSKQSRDHAVHVRWQLRSVIFWQILPSTEATLVPREGKANSERSARTGVPLPIGPGNSSRASASPFFFSSKKKRRQRCGCNGWVGFTPTCVQPTYCWPAARASAQQQENRTSNQFRWSASEKCTARTTGMLVELRTLGNMHKTRLASSQNKVPESLRSLAPKTNSLA